jgi:hypothetical protein
MKTAKMTLALAVGLVTPLSTAVAQSVPQKYQGDWVDQTGGRITIGTRTINFVSGSKETITSIRPGTENGEKMLVNYGSVELVWYLTKVNGREVLIAVNAEEPTSIFIYQRK